MTRTRMRNEPGFANLNNNHLTVQFVLFTIKPIMPIKRKTIFQNSKNQKNMMKKDEQNSIKKYNILKNIIVLVSVKCEKPTLMASQRSCCVSPSLRANASRKVISTSTRLIVDKIQCNKFYKFQLHWPLEETHFTKEALGNCLCGLSSSFHF